MKKVPIGLLLSVVVLLTACQRQYSYEYLMEHPERLSVARERCQRKTLSEQECVLVNKASQDVMALSLQYTSDPMNFGQKILQSQIALAKLQTALKTATAAYNEVSQKEPTDDAVIQAQKMRVKEAESKVREQNWQVKYRWAIIRYVDSKYENISE